MRVDIPYDRENVTIEYCGGGEVLQPDPCAVPDGDEVIRGALERPTDGRSFVDFAAGVRRLLVVVSDATRATPTARVLKCLGGALTDHRDVTYIVAAGTHRPPSGEELEGIFGEMLGTVRDRIVAHDARSDDAVIDLGATPRGTPVRMNRLVGECDGILTIGAVKPHYFAGFAGGRKAFLPGIAHHETIQANHSHALSENARPMGLLGNPVAQDMEDAVRLLPHRNIYSVQLVLTPEKELVAAHAGDLGGTFRAAVKDATALYSVPLSRRGNIVVTANPHPMDINLYQSQHAMENGWLALEPPGVLVLVSKCRDGVGSDAFLDHFDELRRRGAGQGFTREEYRLGMHKASRVMAMKREAKIFAVTGLGPEVVERAGMRPFGDVQEALDAAVSHVTGMGAEPRTIFLPFGGTSVPTISGNNTE